MAELRGNGLLLEITLTKTRKCCDSINLYIHFENLLVCIQLA